MTLEAYAGTRTYVPGEPLEVTLPVCPECGLVSKQPHTPARGRVVCVGPRGEIHKRVRMVNRLFREVVE